MVPTTVVYRAQVCDLFRKNSCGAIFTSQQRHLTSLLWRHSGTRALTRTRATSGANLVPHVTCTGIFEASPANPARTLRHQSLITFPKSLGCPIRLVFNWWGRMTLYV